MSKILIVGSKGFIGSNCYHSFRGRSEENTVFGADVVVDYNDPCYFQIDALNFDFKELFRTHKFDYCINCAGAASVPDSFINPARDFALNVNLVVHLLNAIREGAPSCVLIQMSSAAVYGNPVTLPVPETQDLKPLSPYGYHKKEAEELCGMYSQHFNVRSVIFRIFSAYGEGLTKQLFWDLYKKSKKGEDLVLFGTGNETRDFIHIDDIVQGVQVVMNHPDLDHAIINMGNGIEITIKEAAEKLMNALGVERKLIFNGKTREGDPLYWKADIGYFEKLGYKQKIAFDEGVLRYSKWVKDQQ
jgi:dTDP-glucose 4,6-dehydratase/UDP-glucose 4-epimerase